MLQIAEVLNLTGDKQCSKPLLVDDYTTLLHIEDDHIS